MVKKAKAEAKRAGTGRKGGTSSTIGPANLHTPETLGILADEGYRWFGDAFDDDVPYVAEANGKRGQAHQDVATEIIGQARPCFGETGVEYHRGDDGTRR